MSPWVWWVLAAVAFAVGEMLTTTLVVGPFAAGALGAALADVAGLGLLVQALIFLALSGAAFVALRPVARRHRSMPPRIRTGTDRLIGEGAVVVDEVTRDAGTVRLDGETWSARAYEEDAVLAAGARVQVVEIRGATALVAE